MSLFISFEGVEGCGKSTQLARLAERLRGLDRRVVVTREPGGTELGRGLRSMLLRPTEAPMQPLAELLLYTADRAQHLGEVIEPALARGSIVLCDRYLDATIAYQGHARGLGVELVLQLHEPPPLDRRPDRTVLLDVDPEVALGRARQRDSSRSSGDTEGRFEGEPLEFHRGVREGYLAQVRADPSRFRVVDGVGAVDDVGRRVADALVDLLPELAA